MSSTAGAATTATVGFETSEGYTAGLAPIAPWTVGTTGGAVITSSVSHTGSQSLGITGNIRRANFDGVPALGEAGSMSVDVRPANYQYNYYTQGGVLVHTPGVSNDMMALFSVGTTGVAGQRCIRLDADTSATYVANWIPDTWYNVTFDFTATHVTWGVTGANVNLSRTELRNDVASNEFGLLGADENTTYYDNFILVPEPSTLALSLMGLGGLTLLRRRS